MPPLTVIVPATPPKTASSKGVAALFQDWQQMAPFAQVTPALFHVPVPPPPGTPVGLQLSVC
jgi:hypothetical protein